MSCRAQEGVGLQSSRNVLWEGVWFGNCAVVDVAVCRVSFSVVVCEGWVVSVEDVQAWGAGMSEVSDKPASLVVLVEANRAVRRLGTVPCGSAPTIGGASMEGRIALTRGCELATSAMVGRVAIIMVCVRCVGEVVGWRACIRNAGAGVAFGVCGRRAASVRH